MSAQQTPAQPTAPAPAAPAPAPLPAPSVPSTASLCASADRLAQAVAKHLGGAS